MNKGRTPMLNLGPPITQSNPTLLPLSLKVTEFWVDIVRGMSCICSDVNCMCLQLAWREKRIQELSLVSLLIGHCWLQ